MKQYFANCTTLDEAKKMYRKLAFQMHPDRGGNEVEFKEMLNQFHAFRPATEKFKGESDQWVNFGPVYSSIIDQLLNIDGIIVEVVGSYIWLSGNTFEAKGKIKSIDTQGHMEAGWASRKKQWYFKPAGYRPRSRQEHTMDELRGMFGSTTVTRDSRKRKDEENTLPQG